MTYCKTCNRPISETGFPAHIQYHDEVECQRQTGAPTVTVRWRVPGTERYTTTEFAMLRDGSMAVRYSEAPWQTWTADDRDPDNWEQRAIVRAVTETAALYYGGPSPDDDPVTRAAWLAEVVR